MTGMDQHEQAIIAHETMTNGSADAHQKNGGKSSEDDGK
uniref:Silver-binding protein n=1 Tax=Klebsiella pneumoniae TaxID=573 RepID=A0A8B0SSZ4_KLEPN|nr:Silver-binding protein [Klebsiella pneumoniae]